MINPEFENPQFGRFLRGHTEIPKSIPDIHVKDPKERERSSMLDTKPQASGQPTNVWEEIEHERQERSSFLENKTRILKNLKPRSDKSFFRIPPAP